MEKYQIIKHVTGPIFAVERVTDGQRFTMKRISSAGLDQRNRRQAQLEINLMHRLNHPHIVRCVDSFSFSADGDENLCVVMETYTGGDLSHMIDARKTAGTSFNDPNSPDFTGGANPNKGGNKKGRRSGASSPQPTPLNANDDDGVGGLDNVQYFSEQQVMRWVVQMALAVHYLHSHRIVHRDIKAQNVFIDGETGELALGDFGIAHIGEYKREAQKSDGKGYGDGQLAAAPSGTPQYMAPEVFNGGECSPKSDMWALGCIMYELMCLRHPFESKDISSLIVKVLRGQFQPVPNHFSDDCKQLLVRLLDQDPQRRPPIDSVLTSPLARKHVSQYFADRSAVQRPSLGGQLPPIPAATFNTTNPSPMVSPNGGSPIPGPPSPTPISPVGHTPASQQVGGFGPNAVVQGRGVVASAASVASMRARAYSDGQVMRGGGGDRSSRQNGVNGDGVNGSPPSQYRSASPTVLASERNLVAQMGALSIVSSNAVKSLHAQLGAHASPRQPGVHHEGRSSNPRPSSQQGSGQQGTSPRDRDRVSPPPRPPMRNNAGPQSRRASESPPTVRGGARTARPGGPNSMTGSPSQAPVGAGSSLTSLPAPPPLRGSPSSASISMDNIPCIAPTPAPGNGNPAERSPKKHRHHGHGHGHRRSDRSERDESEVQQRAGGTSDLRDAQELRGEFRELRDIREAREQAQAAQQGGWREAHAGARAGGGGGRHARTRSDCSNSGVPTGPYTNGTQNSMLNGVGGVGGGRQELQPLPGGGVGGGTFHSPPGPTQQFTPVTGGPSTFQLQPPVLAGIQQVTFATGGPQGSPTAQPMTAAPLSSIIPLAAPLTGPGYANLPPSVVNRDVNANSGFLMSPTPTGTFTGAPQPQHAGTFGGTSSSCGAGRTEHEQALYEATRNRSDVMAAAREAQRAMLYGQQANNPRGAFPMVSGRGPQ